MEKSGQKPLELRQSHLLTTHEILIRFCAKRIRIAVGAVCDRTQSINRDERRLTIVRGHRPRLQVC
jgi:hypothetical protein